MIVWHSTSITVASCALLVTIGAGRTPIAAAVQSGRGQPPPPLTWRQDSLKPNDAWNTLTLDIRVERRRLTKSGEAIVPSAPVTKYNIQRSLVSGRWKTIIRVLGIDRAPAYSLSGALIPPDPFPVSRIEDDEDGSAARVYDSAGQLMKSTSVGGVLDKTATELPRSVGLDWLDALVATTAKRSARQQIFERQFGRATTTGAVSRFLRTTPDGSDEVIIDPVNMVPLETNAVVRGLLLSHRTFAYAPAPEAVVRARMHAETLISVASGDRVAVDTTFSNIRLEWR